METQTTNTVKTVGCNCPILRFCFNNHSVFELVCKTLIMVIIIPWGSVFLNGFIFSLIPEVYSSSAAWPILVLSLMVIYFVTGVTLSTISIVRFSKKIKTVSR